MVTKLEMAKHMWKVYTKNAIRFGRVEIYLNSTIKIINRSNCGDTVICEFGRFAEESEFFNFVKKDVERLNGKTVIIWGSNNG